MSAKVETFEIQKAYELNKDFAPRTKFASLFLQEATLKAFASGQR